MAKEVEKTKETEKDKALELAIAQIEKQFGKGAIMKLGKDAHVPVEVIPTGSLMLDIAIGVGGIPRGRVIEIFGPESSGKTTICLHIIAEAQRKGSTAAFIDVEHALDPGYAKRIGVNIEGLLVSQPNSGEEALEIAETLVRSGACDVIVVDSVAALVTRAELEGEMGDSHMGVQARLMSQALRKLTSAINHTKSCVIFTNQLREKIGIMFGNPEVTPGGRALKFYASLRLDIRRIENLKVGDAVVGARVRIKVVKNKVAPPFRQAEFEMFYNEGINKAGDLLDAAVEEKIIDKSGTWFVYGEKRLGQGRDNAKAYLTEHPEDFAEIDKKIRAKFAPEAKEKEKEKEKEAKK